MASNDEPSNNDLILAFLLTLGAGLATTIGSSAALFSILQNKTILAIGLSVSAGVMIYVSFAEIFCVKAVESFEESIGDKYAMPLATACFFSGILLCWLLNIVVHQCFGHKHSHDIDEMNKQPSPIGMDELNNVVPVASRKSSEYRNQQYTTESSESEIDLIDSKRKVIKNENIQKANIDGCNIEITINRIEEKDQNDKDTSLIRTGFVTALAVALHNFPEGLATFVATLDDPSVGIAIAVAIAIHNIPEGICVAMPIYYSTGSRCKGFWYSFLSGITEPIGAVVGYFLMKEMFSSQVYGILFGLVAGMMTYISFAELLPTAQKYQSKNKPWIVPLGVFSGMFVMALSLVLFAL